MDTAVCSFEERKLIFMQIIHRLLLRVDERGFKRGRVYMGT